MTGSIDGIPASRGVISVRAPPAKVASIVLDTSPTTNTADLLMAVDLLWSHGQGSVALRRDLILLLLELELEEEGGMRLGATHVLELLRGRQRARGVEETALCSAQALQDMLEQPDMRRCIRRTERSRRDMSANVAASLKGTTNNNSNSSVTSAAGRTGSPALADDGAADGERRLSGALSLDVAGLLDLAGLSDKRDVFSSSPAPLSPLSMSFESTFPALLSPHACAGSSGSGSAATSAGSSGGLVRGRSVVGALADLMTLEDAETAAVSGGTGVSSSGGAAAAAAAAGSSAGSSSVAAFRECMVGALQQAWPNYWRDTNELLAVALAYSLLSPDASVANAALNQQRLPLHHLHAADLVARVHALAETGGDAGFSRSFSRLHPAGPALSHLLERLQLSEVLLNPRFQSFFRVYDSPVRPGHKVVALVTERLLELLSRTAGAAPLSRLQAVPQPAASGSVRVPVAMARAAAGGGAALPHLQRTSMSSSSSAQRADSIPENFAVLGAPSDDAVQSGGALPQFLFDYEVLAGGTAGGGGSSGPASAPGPEAWRARHDSWRDQLEGGGTVPLAGIPHSLPHQGPLHHPPHGLHHDPVQALMAQHLSGMCGAGGVGQFAGGTSGNAPPPPPVAAVTRLGWPAHMEPESSGGRGGGGGAQDGSSWQQDALSAMSAWSAGQDGGGGGTGAWAHDQQPHQPHHHQLPGGALRSMLQGGDAAHGGGVSSHQQIPQQQQRDENDVAFASRFSSSQDLVFDMEALSLGVPHEIANCWSQQTGGHNLTSAHSICGSVGNTSGSSIGRPSSSSNFNRSFGGISRNVTSTGQWDSHDQQYNGRGTSLLSPPGSAAGSGQTLPTQEQYAAHLQESASWPSSLSHLPHQLEGQSLEGQLQSWYDVMRSASDPLDLPAATGWARQLAMASNVCGGKEQESGSLEDSPASTASQRIEAAVSAAAAGGNGSSGSAELESALEAIIAFDSSAAATAAAATGGTPRQTDRASALASQMTQSMGSRRGSEGDVALHPNMNWAYMAACGEQLRQQQQRRDGRVSVSSGSSNWPHQAMGGGGGAGVARVVPRGSSTDGGMYMPRCGSSGAMDGNSCGFDAAAAALFHQQLASLSHLQSMASADQALAAAAWLNGSVNCMSPMGGSPMGGNHHAMGMRGHHHPTLASSFPSLGDFEASRSFAALYAEAAAATAAAAGGHDRRLPMRVPGGGMAALSGTGGLRVGSAPGPSAATGRAIVQRLPPRLTRRLEELVSNCRHIEWRHFDPGVIKVLAQLCESGEEDVFEELDLLEATDLSGVEYMPAYLNKRLNNKLWSRRKAAEGGQLLQQQLQQQQAGLLLQHHHQVAGGMRGLVNRSMQQRLSVSSDMMPVASL